jgi:hypothetical protein
MNMLNVWVRSELHDMINWYIGTLHGFNLSTGKAGKYIKNIFLQSYMHNMPLPYSGSDYDDIWAAVDIMCDLFHTLALAVASILASLINGRRKKTECMILMSEYQTTIVFHVFLQMRNA